MRPQSWHQWNFKEAQQQRRAELQVTALSFPHWEALASVPSPISACFPIFGMRVLDHTRVSASRLLTGMLGRIPNTSHPGLCRLFLLLAGFDQQAPRAAQARLNLCQALSSFWGREREVTIPSSQTGAEPFGNHMGDGSTGGQDPPGARRVGDEGQRIFPTSWLQLAPKWASKGPGRRLHCSKASSHAL